MFKIPDWAEDIPITNVNFLKDNEVSKTKKPVTEIKKKLSLSENINKIDANGHAIINKHTKPKPEVVKINGHSTEKIKNKVNKKKIKQAKMHKQIANNIVNTKKKKASASKVTSDGVQIQSCDMDKPDEMLLNVRKKKINDQIHKDDSEEILFSNQEIKETKIDVKSKQEITHKKNTNIQVHAISKSSQAGPKLNKKKQMIKYVLENGEHRNHISVSDGNKLRERMLDRLKAAQFRYLNEKLYTSSGSEAQNLFKSDPIAFQTYHEGYQQQVKKWPVNPLNIIVKKIMKMPKSHLIADMGCGEAALSKRVPHNVRSFDLVAASEAVEACDMAHTPLLTASVDVVVYCLALMGTNLTQYLVEANRVLKVGGHLLIAEVESRFDDVDAFAKEVQRLGFKLKELDKSQQVFFFMQFTKNQEPPVKKSKLPELTLKPCLYKRR